MVCYYSHPFISTPQTEDITKNLPLHELSHALLGHNFYERDNPSSRTRRLGVRQRLSLQIDMESRLIWILFKIIPTLTDNGSARSSCPKCETIGVQTRDSLYRCVSCGHGWRVNEARLLTSSVLFTKQNSPPQYSRGYFTLKSLKRPSQQFSCCGG